MSGTTAKTSFSQEEIMDLDPDVMVDVLPSLATAAEELAKLIVPLDPAARPVVRKEIRTLGTKHNKLFKNRMDALNIHKHSFGSTEYIQPSIVLRALLSVQNIKDVPEGPWRPDSIIYKINLAQMLNSMLITLRGNGNEDVTTAGYSAIEHLDFHFASAIAGPVFRQDALSLCLAILTQLTIVRLTFYMADLSFVPSAAIARIFYAEDERGNLIEDESGNPVFRHRNVLHIPTMPDDDQPLIQATIQDAANQLMSAFDDANAETWMPALGQLRAQHPWDDFMDYAIQYYFDRKQDLDTQIAASGGMNQIIVDLAGEVERRSDVREADTKRQSFSRPGGTPKKGFGKDGIRALKARERQVAPAVASAVPVAQMIQPPLPPAADIARHNDQWQPVAEDHVQLMPPSQAQSTARSTLEALSGLQNQQREKATKGKGRSLLDRQEGAHRVAFDESQLTQYQLPDYHYPASSAPERGPYYESPRRGNPGKRPHQAMDEEPEEFDPTQDEGFQADNRDTTTADARRRQIPAQTAPPAVRFSSMGATPGPASGTPASGSAQGASPAKRQRKNPGSSIPPPPPPFDPDNYAEVPREDRLALAKIAARHGTVQASQRKPQQVRQPWSADEENYLIDLIEQECSDGISYSKLKNLDNVRPDGPKLAQRSAEDIRFKARNMKETFMK